MLQSQIDNEYKKLVGVPSKVHRYTSGEDKRSYRKGVSNQYYGQNPYPMPVLSPRRSLVVIPKFLKPIPVSVSQSLENLWKCPVNRKIEEIKNIKLRKAQYSLNSKKISNVSLIRTFDKEDAGIKSETSNSRSLFSDEELSTPYDSNTSDIFDTPISNLQKKDSSPSPPGSSTDHLKGRRGIFSFPLNDWSFIRAFFYVDTLSPTEPKNPEHSKVSKEPKKPKTLKQKTVSYKDKVLQEGDIKVNEKKYDTTGRKTEVKEYIVDERKYKIIQVKEIKTGEIKEFKIVEISNSKIIEAGKEKNNKHKKNNGDRVNKENIFESKSTELNTIKTDVFSKIPKKVKDRVDVVVPAYSFSESKRRKVKQNLRTKKGAVFNYPLRSAQTDQEPKNRKMEPSDVKPLLSMPTLQWNQYTYPLNNSNTQIDRSSEIIGTIEPDEYKFVDSLLDQSCDSAADALVPDFDSILNELETTIPIIDPDNPENTLQMYPRCQEEMLAKENENLGATSLSNLPATSQSNVTFQEHENCVLFSPYEDNKENWKTNVIYSQISDKNNVNYSAPLIQTDCNVTQNTSDTQTLNNLNNFNNYNFKYYSGGKSEYYNRPTTLGEENIRNLHTSQFRPHFNQPNGIPSVPGMMDFLHYQYAYYPKANNINSANYSSRKSNNIASSLKSVNFSESNSILPYRSIPSVEVCKGNSMNTPIVNLSYTQHQPTNIQNVKTLKSVNKNRHQSQENQPDCSNGIASLQQNKSIEITKDRLYAGNPMYPMESLFNIPKFPPGFDYIGYPFNHLLPPSLPYYHPYFNYALHMLPPFYPQNYFHSSVPTMRPSAIGSSTKKAKKLKSNVRK